MLKSSLLNYKWENPNSRDAKLTFRLIVSENLHHTIEGSTFIATYIICFTYALMAYIVRMPPKFDVLIIFIWKIKMTIFLHLLESFVAKATTKPFVHPNGNEDT